jgi:hypothetical protein
MKETKVSGIIESIEVIQEQIGKKERAVSRLEIDWIGIDKEAKHVIVYEEVQGYFTNQLATLHTRRCGFFGRKVHQDLEISGRQKYITVPYSFAEKINSRYG